MEGGGGGGGGEDSLAYEKGGGWRFISIREGAGDSLCMQEGCAYHNICMTSVKACLGESRQTMLTRQVLASTPHV